MGGSKQKTQQQQQQQYSGQNTYGWEVPPDTADIAAQRGFQFQKDPRISHAFAKAANRMSDTYANPLGGYTTPQLRDAVMRTGTEDLAQQEAQAGAEENYSRQALDYAKLADVAAMTQPRLVQQGQSGTSSGTATGTTTQTQSPLGSIISGGSGIASALIM